MITSRDLKVGSIVMSNTSRNIYIVEAIRSVIPFTTTSATVIAYMFALDQGDHNGPDMFHGFCLSLREDIEYDSWTIL